MRLHRTLTLIATVSTVLVGCDRCSGNKSTTSEPSTPGAAQQASAPQAEPEDNTPKGLEFEDVKEGTGQEAANGKTVTIHYVGKVKDGAQFDSTRERNQPVTIILGTGMVLAGLDQGVKGMKEGGVRKLSVPPALGYGQRSVGTLIPPNSPLEFEVELVSVGAKKPAEAAPAAPAATQAPVATTPAPTPESTPAAAPAANPKVPAKAKPGKPGKMAKPKKP